MGDQALPDLKMALMMVNSFRMQATGATLDGLGVARAHKRVSWLDLCFLPG